MKAMFAGFAAIIVISIGAYFALEAAGFSTKDTFTGENVRIE